MAAKCKRGTEIRVAASSATDSIVVARAMTTWGYVDLTTGRPIRIPESVRSAFGITRAALVSES